VLGRNVAGDETDADQPPGKIPAGQKIIWLLALSPLGYDSDYPDEDEVADERGGVEHREVH
jgi:hypothetical protein